MIVWIMWYYIITVSIALVGVIIKYGRENPFKKAYEEACQKIIDEKETKLEQDYIIRILSHLGMYMWGTIVMLLGIFIIVPIAFIPAVVVGIYEGIKT